MLQMPIVYGDIKQTPTEIKWYLIKLSNMEKSYGFNPVGITYIRMKSKSNYLRRS
jgi:hypothetical protein